jgi:hypothetical protein
VNLRTRIAAGATALAMVTLFGVAAIANAGTATHAEEFNAPITTTVDVTGTLVDSSLANPQAFTGQMSDVSVTMLNGAAALTGTLTGTGLPATGTKVTTVVKAVTTQAPTAKLAAPMATPEPTRTGAPLCRVLTLDVTDLHLDLLGLVVLVPKPGLHLIVGGSPRPGALLGNVLCNLAGGPDPVLTIPPPDVPPAAVPPAAEPPAAEPPAAPAAPTAPATTAAPAALPPSILLG